MLAAILSNKVSWSAIGGDYWQQSRRPLASLAFVAPLLLIYELGVLLLGPLAMRNGADVWLRQLLDVLGFSQYFLLPLLTVGLLLGWHHLTRQSWRIEPGVLYTMLAESATLAIVLVVIARMQSSFLSLFVASSGQSAIRASIWPVWLNWHGGVSWLGEMVGYVGAGVYEELLFRLMLLPFIAWLLKSCGMTWGNALLVAVLISSVIFSGAHHVGSEGEPIVLRNFCFRLIAGIFFATLFVYRGFGIAAGSHALYDILVSSIY